jgi:hypothetical protein
VLVSRKPKTRSVVLELKKRNFSFEEDELIKKAELEVQVT